MIAAASAARPRSRLADERLAGATVAVGAGVGWAVPASLGVGGLDARPGLSMVGLVKVQPDSPVEVSSASPRLKRSSSRRLGRGRSATRRPYLTTPGMLACTTA